MPLQRYIGNGSARAPHILFSKEDYWYYVHLGWVRWGLLIISVSALIYGQGTDLLGDDFLDELFGERAASPQVKDTLPPPVTEYNPLEDTVLSPPKPLPPLRIIDSPVQSGLPISKWKYIFLSTNRPFQVQIVRPNLQNEKGHPLIHGFDTWYLYIVKAEQLRVNQKVIQTAGLPVYLAIVSHAKTMEELPTVLDGPALMLKGIVDYGDTIVKYFKKEKKRLQYVLDSLMKQPVSGDELQAEEQEKLLERVADSLDYAEAYYELYRAFKQAKRSSKLLVAFFLSHPFNRSLTYSIYSAPYALPRYEPPGHTAPAEDKRRRHKRS